MHRLDEGPHALRLHVGVEAVAQVGDVAPGAEALQHLLDDLRDPLLGGNIEGEIKEGGGVVRIEEHLTCPSQASKINVKQTIETVEMAQTHKKETT